MIYDVNASPKNQIAKLSKPLISAYESLQKGSSRKPKFYFFKLRKLRDFFIVKGLMPPGYNRPVRSRSPGFNRVIRPKIRASFHNGSPINTTIILPPTPTVCNQVGEMFSLRIKGGILSHIFCVFYSRSRAKSKQKKREQKRLKGERKAS